MPKASYGATSYQRVQQLFLALVDFANDALDIDAEAKLDWLRSQIQIHWQTDQRLVIRTKLRYLQTLTQLIDPTAPLTLPQLKEALKHLETFLGILEDNRTLQQGSDRWHFTLNLGSPRWEREANLKQLAQAWNQKRSNRPQSSLTGTSQPAIAPGGEDWQTLCRHALNTYLTTNPLTAQDGIAFDVREMYIPLGIQARPHRRREIAQAVDDEEALDAPIYQPEDLLRQAQSHVPRMAIVGEPGVGKTTFLQNIALELLEHSEHLPVWISLADLEGQSLETYLTQNWLKRTLRVLSVSPALQADFTTQVMQGRVWLLLDAVDEMGVSASTALNQLAQQIQGWLSNTPILLTCRLNVWDAGNNALNGFTTYQCLSFSARSVLGKSPVQQFIARWFQANPSLATALCHELDRPDLKRLRGIAQNPLCLALLCRAWTLNPGQLPATKASLYRQFVEALYTWKQDKFPTTWTQRQHLNQALAHLALTAMSQSPARFRFSHGFVCQCFARFDLELLTLALQLGLLNPIAVAQTGESVYAFYHPTFQDYFAAQGIVDWRYFLNTSRAHALSFLPLFESQWQEVLLLWLGREDIPPSDKAKLIQALLAFEDACGGFYHHRAYFLAAMGLAEFPDSTVSPDLIPTLVQWRFGQPANGTRPPVLSEQAGLALLKSDRAQVIRALEVFVPTAQPWIERWLAAHSLGKNYDRGNAVAIAALEGLLAEKPPLDLRIEIAKSLGLVKPGHPLALNTLREVIQSNPSDLLCRKAAHRLGQLAPGHPVALQTLEDLLANTSEPYLRQSILNSLAQIAPGHPALETNGKAPTPGRRISQRAKSTLPPEEYFALLLAKLAATPDPSTQIRIAGQLGRSERGYEPARDALLQVLRTSDRKSVLRQAADQLKDCSTRDRIQSTLPWVREIYLEAQAKHQNRYHECYRLLWHWAHTLSYESFCSAWQQPLDKPSFNRYDPHQDRL